MARKAREFTIMQAEAEIDTLKARLSTLEASHTKLLRTLTSWAGKPAKRTNGASGGKRQMVQKSVAAKSSPATTKPTAETAPATKAKAKTATTGTKAKAKSKQPAAKRAKAKSANTETQVQTEAQATV